MNFSWLGLLIFAMIAVVVSAGGCPAPFKHEKNHCVTDRTIRGECPHGSTYKINVNKCVYGA
ncbi:hypothetical protein KR215_007921 [Drosophila sulfurigaster]|uniref:Uncharacterized protein LOC117574846 n=1 Tax=Drosophila albomicans TaxID=7291 RepID=A0A6P8XNV3_DROAB|nr:uncharacterized protein LOC117574846 [Drosophila albomicans]XP_060648053.1 uncharacterized protein LOC132785793 [Drosophila nasuta]XP_062123882.1 uncharacterized protein LOC133837223 [Drosophila sulfurigaster albostrigata]KAH8404310.1 hypothetical protein KR215_007921 [Drosophila sulfurigaster]